MSNIKMIFWDGTTWVLSQGLGQKFPLQQCFCAAEAQVARTKPPLPARLPISSALRRGHILLDQKHK